MRARLYWPIVVAAAALVGLLTYGVASKGTDTSLDQALSDGKAVEAPGRRAAGARPLRDRLAGRLQGQGRGHELLGILVPAVRQGAAAARAHAAALQKRGATVLGVNIQDTTEDALGYVKRFDLTYPSLRDVDRKFARKFGTNAYPETFVIDRDGQDHRAAPRSGRPGVAGSERGAAAVRALAVAAGRARARRPRAAAARRAPR